MSFSSRSRVVRLLLAGVLGLGCLVAAQERPPIGEQIAETYGLSSFPQVEQIRYTFNVDLGQIKLSRSWVWEPKTDRVSYESKDKNGKTDRKSTRLNSSHGSISYAVFCLKKKTREREIRQAHWYMTTTHSRNTASAR